MFLRANHDDLRNSNEICTWQLLSLVLKLMLTKNMWGRMGKRRKYSTQDVIM